MKDAEQVVAFLAPLARDWIVAQRDRYRPNSHPLRPKLVEILHPFFNATTLRTAQYAVGDELENPPFYAELQQAAPGVPLIEFREMEGITFDDTILVRSAASGAVSLFFHELIHVVQYAKLRPAEFAARYIRGWALNGLEYDKIPLELDAYELQARFEAKQAFSAEEAAVAMLSARTAT